MTAGRGTRAFTLIELVVASAVAAVMMAAVMMIVGAMGRERRRLAIEQAKPDRATLVALFRRDLTDALTIAPIDQRTLVLTGHGALDPRTLSPTGRLARVTYRIRGDRRGGSILVREQESLDDPLRRLSWTEVVAYGVTALSVVPTSLETGDARNVAMEEPDESQPTAYRQAVRAATRPVPATARLTIDFASTNSIEEDLRLR